jgi:hypothetical protein
MSGRQSWKIVHVRVGSLSTELGCRPMSGLPPIAMEEPTFRFGSFVPKHEVAALQPLRGSKSREAGSQVRGQRWRGGKVNTISSCIIGDAYQEQQGSSGRPAP